MVLYHKMIFIFLVISILVCGGLATASCPPEDGDLPTYIPHDDCTKFWQCSNGIPYLFKCPGDLHFNPILNVCDWPNYAGCQPASTATSHEKTVSTTWSTSKSSDSASCPPVDGDLPTYIPHDDCTKFWQCSNGIPYLFKCPGDLHFNPMLNVCDWPKYAGCQPASTTTSLEKTVSTTWSTSKSSDSEVNTTVSTSTPSINTVSSTHPTEIHTTGSVSGETTEKNDSVATSSAGYSSGETTPVFTEGITNDQYTTTSITQTTPIHTTDNTSTTETTTISVPEYTIEQTTKEQIVGSTTVNVLTTEITDSEHTQISITQTTLNHTTDNTSTTEITTISVPEYTIEQTTKEQILGSTTENVLTTEITNSEYTQISITQTTLNHTSDNTSTTEKTTVTLSEPTNDQTTDQKVVGSTTVGNDNTAENITSKTTSSSVEDGNEETHVVETTVSFQSTSDWPNEGKPTVSSVADKSEEITENKGDSSEEPSSAETIVSTTDPDESVEMSIEEMTCGTDFLTDEPTEDESPITPSEDCSTEDENCEESNASKQTTNWSVEEELTVSPSLDESGEQSIDATTSADQSVEEGIDGITENDDNGSNEIIEEETTSALSTDNSNEESVEYTDNVSASEESTVEIPEQTESEEISTEDGIDNDTSDEIDSVTSDIFTTASFTRCIVSTLLPTIATEPPTEEPDEDVSYICLLLPDDFFNVAHPRDCSRYILCYKGTADVRNCPSGLWFSSKHSTCVSPKESDCKWKSSDQWLAIC